MRIKHIPALALAVIATLFVGSIDVSATAPLSTSEQLGKSLFFDASLSVNKNQSCASCHAPEAGWVGATNAINTHGAVYEGSIAGAFGDRKPPSAAYATQSPILSVDRKAVFSGGNFWDGRATGETLGSPAAEQARGPFLNPVEQALPDSACVVFRACTGDYGSLIGEVWGADACGVTWPTDADARCAAGTPLRSGLPSEDVARVDQAYDNLARSIAAYEGSSEVNAFSSKYDLSLGGKAKLTKQERLGYSLFQGKAQCKACHLSSGRNALFTDYTFDNLGVPKNPENPVYATHPDYVDRGLGGYLATRADYKGYAADNVGKQKVPTLRNVALGAGEYEKAYGHNGYFKSLWSIVHFYNTRDVLATCPGDYTEAQALAANCWPAPEVAANVNTAELGDLGLTYEEERAIVAYLETLSDGYTP